MSVASLGTLRRRAEQQIAPCSRVPSNSTVSYRVVSYCTAQHTSSRPSIRLAIVYIYIAVSPVRKSRAHPATLDAQPWSPAHARAPGDPARTLSRRRSAVAFTQTTHLDLTPRPRLVQPHTYIHLRSLPRVLKNGTSDLTRPALRFVRRPSSSIPLSPCLPSTLSPTF